MLPNQENFLPTVKGDKVAICGVHVRNDAVHVGIFFRYQEERLIFHYDGGVRILLEDATSPHFRDYFFAEIDNFPSYYIVTLAALSELIQQNRYHYGI